MEEITKKAKRKVSKGAASERECSLLQEYHAQGLKQSKVSFWFSISSACVGFTVIITSILTFDEDAEITEQTRPFVTLIAGVIIDSVSTLFFVQSNKARRLMTEFFDKYRADRKLEESLSLAEEITDPVLQSKLRIVLALKFAEVSLSDDMFPLVFSGKQEHINSHALMLKEKSKVDRR